MNVLILDDYQQGMAALPSMAKLRGHAVTILHRPLAEDPGAEAALAAAEGLVPVRERTVINEALLQRMPRLRHIAQTGKAGKHLDLEACRRRGISVSEGAGTVDGAAELAFLLVMAALRNLPQEIAGLQAGRFGDRFGRTLKGRTLGILGFGKAGAMLAGFARAFSMRVVVHGSEASMQRAVAAGCQACADRAQFFSGSDAISIQLRLNPQTRGFVREADLMMMKADAVLVNTARAELIDPPGLLKALQAGRPGQYATDVYMQEPPTPASDPVLLTGRVIATPHIGYLDVGSFELMASAAFDNLLAFEAGQPGNVIP